ncbi:hypothetical protein DSO57_1029269, partial [Entomophthora muscae]
MAAQTSVQREDTGESWESTTSNPSVAYLQVAWEWAWEGVPVTQVHAGGQAGVPLQGGRWVHSTRHLGIKVGKGWVQVLTGETPHQIFPGDQEVLGPAGKILYKVQKERKIVSHPMDRGGNLSPEIGESGPNHDEGRSQVTAGFGALGWSSGTKQAKSEELGDIWTRNGERAPGILFSKQDVWGGLGQQPLKFGLKFKQKLEHSSL